MAAPQHGRLTTKAVFHHHSSVSCQRGRGVSCSLPVAHTPCKTSTTSFLRGLERVSSAAAVGSAAEPACWLLLQGGEVTGGEVTGAAPELLTGVAGAPFGWDACGDAAAGCLMESTCW